MRKFLILGASVAALMATAPAAADAATYCPVSKYDYTRGGYGIQYRGANANGMNCASVRYALGQFRAKARRQTGYPRIPRAFFDGWVTWHCWKNGGHRIRCAEYTSNTSFGFRAWVYP